MFTQKLLNVPIFRDEQGSFVRAPGNNSNDNFLIEFDEAMGTTSPQAGASDLTGQQNIVLTQEQPVREQAPPPLAGSRGAVPRINRDQA